MAAEDQPDEVAAGAVPMAVGLLWLAWNGSGSGLCLLRAHREPSHPGRRYENDRLAARPWELHRRLDFSVALGLAGNSPVPTILVELAVQ